MCCLTAAQDRVRPRSPTTEFPKGVRRTIQNPHATVGLLVNARLARRKQDPSSALLRDSRL
jgi:hypothetical protein